MQSGIWSKMEQESEIRKMTPNFSPNFLSKILCSHFILTSSLRSNHLCFATLQQKYRSKFSSKNVEKTGFSKPILKSDFSTSKTRNLPK